MVPNVVVLEEDGIGEDEDDTSKISCYDFDQSKAGNLEGVQRSSQQGHSIKEEWITIHGKGALKVFVPYPYSHRKFMHVQGDTSRSSQPPFDIDVKVAF